MGPALPTEFTPWLSLAGGGLIGFSAVLVMALFGRIAGIAGISGTVLTGLAAPRVAGFDIPQTVSPHLGAMALAGLLVGFGTSLGSGCTSGHGVCGLARLSRRSIAAVATFMATAMLTVFVLRHGLGGKRCPCCLARSAVWSLVWG